VAGPDSIVQITAEAQGLDRLLPAQVPRSGTFWLALPGLNAVIAPLPCPPDDLSLPIYALGPNGQFLVDGTVGDSAVDAPVSVGRLTTPSLRRATLETTLETQANAVVNLISKVQTAAAPTGQRTMSMTMSTAGVPGFGDVGSGTNPYTPTGASYTMPDYGTNLWIAQTAVTNGTFTAIASNTIPAVQYLIQSRTNLLQSDWQTEFPIVGSATTNWTPFSVSQNNRTNLLLRLQSWASSDGSGLPDWWEWQYFGTTGVDPYGNPAGDGWSNFQKFQNSWNPNQFYTPAAPAGLAVQLHQASQTAGLSWLPAAGNVINYTVEKSYQPNSWSPVVTSDFTTTNLNYTDNLAGNTPDPWSGDAYLISYRVKANYGVSVPLTAGIQPMGTTLASSDWTAQVALQPATVSGSIIPGPNGDTYLEVVGVPANAAVIRLTMVFKCNIYSDSFFTNVIHDLPVAAHAYDANTTIHDLGGFDKGTPNRYAHYWTNGAPCYFNATVGAGTYVNFFNTNDWALSGPWLLFQYEKPNLYPTYYYISPDRYYRQATQLFFPNNTYVIFNSIIQARGYALGAQLNVGGAFAGNQVNLPNVWPPDTSGKNFGDHIWHSAEFRSDSAQRWQFWNQVLVQMKLK
jgi:hypothetical protein